MKQLKPAITAFVAKALRHFIAMQLSYPTVYQDCELVFILTCWMRTASLLGLVWMIALLPVYCVHSLHMLCPPCSFLLNFSLPPEKKYWNVTICCIEGVKDCPYKIWKAEQSGSFCTKWARDSAINQGAIVTIPQSAIASTDSSITVTRSPVVVVDPFTIISTHTLFCSH